MEPSERDGVRKVRAGAAGRSAALGDKLKKDQNGYRFSMPTASDLIK